MGMYWDMFVFILFQYSVTNLIYIYIYDIGVWKWSMLIKKCAILTWEMTSQLMDVISYPGSILSPGSYRIPQFMTGKVNDAVF